MKKLIALIALATTTAAIATQVPLKLTATGYTELLVPTSLSYTAGQEAVADDEATEIDETAEAIPACFEIEATYQLGYKVPVVDCTIEGVRTVIAPVSMPKFDLSISLPEEVFAAYYDGDVEQLVQVLDLAGTIEPNAQLCEVIRTVAFSLLGTAD